MIFLWANVSLILRSIFEVDSNRNVNMNMNMNCHCLFMAAFMHAAYKFTYMTYPKTTIIVFKCKSNKDTNTLSILFSPMTSINMQS